MGKSRNTRPRPLKGPKAPKASDVSGLLGCAFLVFIGMSLSRTCSSDPQPTEGNRPVVVRAAEPTPTAKLPHATPAPRVRHDRNDEVEVIRQANGTLLYKGKGKLTPEEQRRRDSPASSYEAPQGRDGLTWDSDGGGPGKGRWRDARGRYNKGPE